MEKNKFNQNSHARRLALRIFTLALCVFALTVSFSQRPFAEKKTEYAFAFYSSGTSTSDQGQIRSLFADMKKTIFVRENFVFTPIYFSNEKYLLRAAKKGEIDFVISSDDYAAYRLVKEYRFQPFLNILYLDLKARKHCIYIKSNKNFRDVKDLKNARISTGATPLDYIMIRHIVGEDPLFFFSSMKKAKDGFSNFYALGLDTCDAIYASDIAYNMMKKTNPGPLKGVKELACAKTTIPFQAIYYSKKVPKPVIERLRAIAKNAYKNPVLKKWQPIHAIQM